MKDGTEKKFDMVMSWKIDRLSRKLEDAIKLVGEFERNTIAQNVKIGMKAKARSGECCGGALNDYKGYK